MRIYDIAFYAAIFFLAGVFAASIFGEVVVGLAMVFLITATTAAVFWFYGKKYQAILSAVTLLGGFYYFVYDARISGQDLPYSKVVFDGVVKKVIQKEKSQELTIGQIRVYAPQYPIYKYGDYLRVSGELKNVSDAYRQYFLKDGVARTVSFPAIELLAHDKGNFLIANLLKFKEKIEMIFARVLPREKAEFLSGLTLGEKSVFSKEFRADLSRSGTSHLVALSGYNITVIAEGLALFLAYFLNKRATFYATLFIIALFTLMTGAEASIVRAAIMGGILLLAGQIGRLYSFRNAITLVAFFMVLYNPKILVFDIGFQLSFAALLGLVYLRPIIAHVLRMKPDDGFLDWRKNLQTTLAAQFAVLPIILKSFGSLSLNGLVSNILILPAIPYTMFLGFVVGVAGFISEYIALIFASLVGVFLSYELALIKFFSHFGYFEGVTFRWWWTVIYYAALVSLIYWFRKYHEER